VGSNPSWPATELFYSFPISLLHVSQESREGSTMAENVKKIIQFLKETRFELKRVTWPSRKEMLAGTTVVLIIVFIVAVFLGIVDLALSKLIKMVISG
jgi:preprotein translocase subunit SecE